MNTLCFVSGNEGKIKEAQEILGFPIDIAKVDLDEIQSLDLEKIVQKKAEAAFEVLKKPLLVDDVGLYVEAWNGFPGPFIKYLREAGGNDLLLQMLKDETNRNVTAVATVGYYNGNKVHTFRGEIKGVITTEPRGTNGWGWTPIFQPEGYETTFAQMEDAEKNAISHRRKAIDKLKEFFKENRLYQ